MKRLAFALGFAIFASHAFAEMAKVHASIPASAKAGSKVMVNVSFDVPQGFHVYSPSYRGIGVPLSVSLANPPSGYRVLALVAGKGELKGHVSIGVPIVTSRASLGKVPLTLKVRFQQCNETVCYPPKTQTVVVTTTMR
jgi:hypothetical protein